MTEQHRDGYPVPEWPPRQVVINPCHRARVRVSPRVGNATVATKQLRHAPGEELAVPVQRDLRREPAGHREMRCSVARSEPHRGTRRLAERSVALRGSCRASRGGSELCAARSWSMSWVVGTSPRSRCPFGLVDWLHAEASPTTTVAATNRADHRGRGPVESVAHTSATATRRA